MSKYCSVWQETHEWRSCKEPDVVHIEKLGYKLVTVNNAAHLEPNEVKELIKELNETLK